MRDQINKQINKFFKKGERDQLFGQGRGRYEARRLVGMWVTQGISAVF